MADTAQQIVGGFLLAGSFVVTEEVWNLAGNMSIFHSFLTVLIVISIGYGALYEAEERDLEDKAELIGIPIRLVSLISVSYLSVAALIFVIAAPETFDASYYISLKVTCIAAIISEFGAARADSIF